MFGAISDSVQLNNGIPMPRLGAGTFRVPDDQVVQVVRWALELGYRHIDTAAVYGNERGAGRAVRESGLLRGEVFVTTKVWNDAQRQGPAAVQRALDESLARLGLDYVDLVVQPHSYATG